jgi:HD superfamily phosphohydrolase
MILRDPVHGLVAFEAKEESIIHALLETRELQRLRRVQQLGLTSLAYPGATHARFSHAIGTAHVMARFIARIRAISADLPKHQQLDTSRAQEGLAAALLHDIGHGPFSHLFEEAIVDGPSHEDWGTRIVMDPWTELHQKLRSFSSELPGRVDALIRGEHELRYLSGAVSGTFDVDRCDYLLRDAHFTGVNYGHFDLDWLLRSFCLEPTHLTGNTPGLAIDGSKGLPAIESFILARLFMFQQVYFHKASRCSDWLLARILERTRELLMRGDAVSGVPRAVESLMKTNDASLPDYLQLDDAVMWTALEQFRHHRDPILADLSHRLLSRQLLKGFELFAEEATAEGAEHCRGIAEDLCKKAGLDPKYYVGLDRPTALAFDESKGALCVLFPLDEIRRPSEVSFLLSRLLGQNLSRPRIIYPVEIRHELHAALSQRAQRRSSRAAEETFAGGSFQLPLTELKVAPHDSGHGEP